MTTVEIMRAKFEPQGTTKLVYMNFGEFQMYELEFVEKMLKELEQIPLKAVLGEKPSNLEKVVCDLLMVASYQRT